MVKHTWLAGKVRKALHSLGTGGKEIACSDLTIKLDMICDKEKQVLYRVLCDFRKSGEITRVRRGAYIYNGKNKNRPPELQAIMWRFLRAKKTVTIDDLVEISGASHNYAAEWVYMLERREIVEKIRLSGARKYRLISDPVIMPVNEDNAKKLRRLRKQKKREALVAVQEAQNAISRARKAIGEIPG